MVTRMTLVKISVYSFWLLVLVWLFS